MATPRETRTMSFAEYLAEEAASDRKHEFLNGEVWAMAGGTPEHGALALEVAYTLRAALDGKPCRLYSSDVRVHVRETGLTTYPDITVVCGALETAEQDPHAIVNPKVIVEVLSDSTEAYDRGAKAAHYRRIASLEEYVLVWQHEPHLEVLRRKDDGRWEMEEAIAGQQIELVSIGARLDVSAIYRNPLAS